MTAAWIFQAANFFKTMTVTKRESINENSTEEADKLRNYVVEALKKNGVDIEAELTKYGNIKDDNGNLVYATREAQIDELVADSMFDVFTNKTTIDRLAKNDRSLARKIAKKFKEILNVIRTKLKMMGETSKNCSCDIIHKNR